jgi:hypothetical protein
MNTTTWITAAPLFIVATTMAQWSSDPLVNTLVSGSMTSCVITHSAPSQDGGVWIAWYDASAGYDIVIQKLDASGVPVFAVPSLVQDQSLSWVQDFDLAAVGDGCAVAWADGDTAGAALVSSTGNIAWQHNLQDGNGYQANAQICGANDDFTVVAWADENVTKVQRIGTDGTLVWDTPVSIGGNGFFLASDIKPASDHDVVISMVHYTNFNGAKTLKVQRVRADGSLAWPTPAIDVFTQGSLQYGSYPEFIADNSGGGIFTWYSTANLQSYIQWIQGSGQRLFGPQGSLIATSGTYLHTAPSACFDATAGEVTAFCTRQSSNQGQDGIQANRFHQNGNAMWGANGIEVAPLSDTWSVLDLSANQLDGLATVSWYRMNTTMQGTIQAQALNASGGMPWGSNPIDVGTPVLSRSDLTSTVTGDMLVATWADAREGADRVWAQNISADGELGSTACTADINGDGVVGVDDVLVLIGAWGTANTAADVNGDGLVDTTDLLLVLAGWGEC